MKDHEDKDIFSRVSIFFNLARCHCSFSEDHQDHLLHNIWIKRLVRRHLTCWPPYKKTLLSNSIMIKQLRYGCRSSVHGLSFLGCSLICLGLSVGLLANVSRVTYLLDCSSLRVFSKLSHICHWPCLCHCIFWVRSCLPFIHMSQGSKVAELALCWCLSKLAGIELVRL